MDEKSAKGTSVLQHIPIGIATGVGIPIKQRFGKQTKVSGLREAATPFFLIRASQA